MQWELEATYPQPFTSFLGFFSFVKLSLGNDSKLLPMGCLTSNYDYLDSLLVSTLGPMVCVAVIGLISFVRSLGAEKKATIWNQGKYAIVVLSFCVLPQYSTTIFRTFLCTKFDGESSYLNADYSVECTGRYDAFFTLAILMVFVYPVGELRCARVGAASDYPDVPMITSRRYPAGLLHHSA